MSVQKRDQVEELGREDVERVALLARLELTEAELDHFAQDLTSVLHHINQLAALDLEGVEPTAHPIAVADVVREDVDRPGLETEAALSNAPEQENYCFKVPQII